MCKIVRNCGKVFRIGTVRYNWPMSAHASQAFSIAHCTDSEDLPNCAMLLHNTTLTLTPTHALAMTLS